MSLYYYLYNENITTKKITNHDQSYNEAWYYQLSSTVAC